MPSLARIGGEEVPAPIHQRLDPVAEVLLRAREPVHQQEGATSLAGLEDHELGGPVGGGVAGDGDGAGGGQPRAPIPKPPMTSARGVVSSSAGTSMSRSAP